MGRFSRFEICGKDRVGITLDILGRFYSREINLVSVEVFPGRLCIMTPELDETTQNVIKKDIQEIEDVISVSDIALMDHEKSERSLRAVIDAVDEGVIAMDRNYEVTIFNNYCEELFGQSKDGVLGSDIRQLVGDFTPVSDLIKQGLDYDHLEAVMEGPRGPVGYVSTGRVMRDDEGVIIGAVASIKDANKVRELASIISSEEEAAFKEIVGNSPALERIKKTIRTVARSNSTVMLRGESGTGKELFARAIHELSGRKGSYVTLNCAALPENLLESELFGYEKGSFTGASSNGKAGLFAEAHGGTIFLDEVGELTSVIQAKILRVLQEGRIRRIGGGREEVVDARVVVATNRNLEEMMEKKMFREDLYYRLNVIPISVPSLNTRREDIPLLLNYFIQRLNRKLGRSITGFSQDFLVYFIQHPWPGNIRQMQNAVERAMNLCEGDVLGIRDLYLDEPTTVLPCAEAYSDEEGPVSLRDAVQKYESSLIKAALNRETSCRKAAKSLGISHTALINKMKKADKGMAR